jgi:hypothetical protein
MFRTQPGTWNLDVFWERTYAEIAQNSSKPPKIAEHPTVERLEPPGQLWCVPDSEHCLKSPLVLLTMSTHVARHIIKRM